MPTGKVRFNNIPREVVEELFKKLDDGTLNYRDASVWLNREHNYSFCKSTIAQNHKKGLKNIKFADYNPTVPTHRDVQESRKATKEKMKPVYARKRKLNKQVDKIMEGKSTSRVIPDLSELNFNKKTVQEAAENILWRPHPGPQTDFLASSETDILYGGQAGGGKSDAMIVDPLRYAHKKRHRALILRRTLKELRELINKSREYYPLAYPGAKFKVDEKTWVFPSGATIEFNYLEKEADVYQYQGQEFTWIGFDEITQLPSEWSWNYLSSRLRTADPDINTYLRCTANPGGVGHEWVKERYIMPKAPNTAWVYGVNPRTGTQLTRKFIPAKLSDNPTIYDDGQYEAHLQALPEIERRRLLEGDWYIISGAAFPEFNKEVHVVEPFTIPRHWKRVRGVDYGYAAPSACVWGAIDPEDGTLVIYRELYEKGLTGEELAERIKELEADDPPMSGVVDYAVFNRTGHVNTVGQILNSSPYFLKLRPANKDRKAGKVQIHERMSTRNKLRPGLQFTSNCVNCIRELTSLPLDKKDPEDVDTHADDHAYDAIRYLVMSLPRLPTIHDLLLSAKRESREYYRPVDTTFGY